MTKYNTALVKRGVEQILTGMGFDWQNNENFLETPDRVARAYYELCKGEYEEIDSLKTFPSHYDGIILIRSIKAVGLCPHHLLPIEYQIAFAYMPQKRVIGLSKIPRIVKRLCARPVLQEDLTKDIVTKFKQILHPAGITVVIKGIHGCMKYRGIEEVDIVQTAELDGYFLTNPASRSEFYSMINE